MTPNASATGRPVLPVTRAVFVLSSILAAIAGVQLYILADHTDRFFAWTIGNPLSATFVGTGFWTGTLLLLFAMREDAWANIRVAMAAVATFVPLMLLTTLLHLAPFHFHSSNSGARVAAWAWMIVYVTVPFVIATVFILQLRAPGDDPPAAGPVPSWIRALLGVNAAISLVVGICLMLIPERLFSLWPWQLTALTAQTIGTGLLSIAVASLWFIRENSWVRGRVGTVPYLTVGALQLIALLRYQGRVEWSRPGAWLYLFFLVGVLIGGVYSTMMVWRLDSRGDVQAVPRPEKT